MSLAPATRIGPYEVSATIGAGGMGEVYRARDTRLARDVAIKVLPAALAKDAERQRRFEQEALATARLNHPNILQVFDVGQHEGQPYLVTELLEGETLRDRLEGGALPARKAIELAIAIASGLGAAHEQGIVHRDLKPENLFITGDGRVKILDFGLAKLVRAEDSDSSLTSAHTIQAETNPGVVMGTAGYMSPEQVRGQKVDHRSDIFSFGTILYEMLAGRRAFHGQTPADMMSAILREDPPDLTAIDEGIPLVLQLVVRHCLEKSPGERFHSAHDLAFQLEAISGSGSGAMAAIAAETTPATQAAVRYRTITHRRGVVYSARFAPDGETILYSASWEGGSTQIYMWRAESPEAIALPLPEADLLAVSRSGEMAINLAPKWAHNGSWRGTLATVPMFGGTPRQIENDVMWADYDPTRSVLAVARDMPDRGTIECPLGHVLCETNGFFSHLRWSPSGETIAFLDHPIPRDDRGSVTIIDRDGNKKTLTETYPTIQGLAWAPAGDEIWFTAAEVDDHAFRRSLHAVNLKGEVRFITGFPGTARLLDIAPDGRLLLVRDEDRIGMMGKAPGDQDELDLSWLDWSHPADLSADGQWLLFEEDRIAGDYVVCLRRTTGEAAVKLGEGSAKAISRDGRWVLAQRPRPGAPLQLLPAGAGRERSIPVGELELSTLVWLPDGKRVFVTGRSADGITRAYILDLETDRFEALGMESPDRAFGAALTANGDLAAVSFTRGRLLLVPLSGGGVADGPTLDAGETIVAFSEDGAWLYVETWGAQSVQVDRVHIESGQREPWKTLSPRDASGVVLVFRVLMVRDGDAYAYACFRILSDLYVVEGLR